MASKKSSFFVNEAVNFVLADDDSASDFDSSGSEVSREDFTDDNDDDDNDDDDDDDDDDKLNVRNQPLPEVVQR